MAITSERLRQTFSEGGAQEIYHEVRAEGDFLGFARQYVFDPDYRVARSALWGLTKATDEELSELQVILDELTEQAIRTENSSTRRLTLNIMGESHRRPPVAEISSAAFSCETSDLPGGQSRRLSMRIVGSSPTVTTKNPL